MSETRLWTEQEVAKHLSCSVGLLRKWRANGGGPVYHHVGRLIRYSESSIISWLSQNQVVKTKLEPVSEDNSTYGINRQ